MLAVLSGQRSKEKDAPSRVRIRPIELKGSVCYQASSTVGTKVLHSNYTKEEIISYVAANLGEGCFSQLQTQGRCVDGTVLVSKKGRQTIKVKKHPTLEPVRIQAHNRVKQYILKEGTAVPFLVDLGVMNREGKIHNTSYDKFKQINRFLEFIEDILPALSREREITILDFGCGKSYLTFAMYYYLKELKGYDVNIIGLDLKEDVIKKCNGLAGKYGYDKLHFLHGDIADYAGHLRDELPVLLLFLCGEYRAHVGHARGGVDVYALGAFLLYPGERLLVLGFIVYPQLFAADYLGHVDPLGVYTEVIAEEFLVAVGSGNTHSL